MSAVLAEVHLKRLGRVPYVRTLEAMRAFTARRTEATPDELWLLEHEPVYTLGQGARAPAPTNAIALVRSDRGGDITYHGPGQVVLYTLVDLVRRGIMVKQLVWLLEQCVIDVIGERAERRAGAPGIYVEGAKVGALGIRVTRGRAYHGLAVNVDMDLSPFAAIDPCGYPGLAVAQLKDLGIERTVEQVGTDLATALIARLGHA